MKRRFIPEKRPHYPNWAVYDNVQRTDIAWCHSRAASRWIANALNKETQTS